MQGAKIKQTILETSRSSTKNRKPNERWNDKGRCKSVQARRSTQASRCERNRWKNNLTPLCCSRDCPFRRNKSFRQHNGKNKPKKQQKQNRRGKRRRLQKNGTRTSVRSQHRIIQR